MTEGERGVSYDDFLYEIMKLPDEQLWRHNQVGDLVGTKNNPDRIEHSALKLLCEAQKGKKGFTYTHYQVEGKDYVSKQNRYIIKYANKHGFAVNLSADSIEHADKLKKLKIAPVTCILPSDHEYIIDYTPKGHKVIMCPAAHRDDMDCAKCKLCANPKREAIIGFPTHGMRAKLMDERLRWTDITEELDG